MTVKILLSSAIAGALMTSALAVSAPSAEAQSIWQKTVEAAEKEGSVVALVQPNRRFRAYVTKQWAADFPKIQLKLTTLRARQFLARLRTERKAGKFLWDVVYSGSFTGYALYPEGALDPLRPEFILPEVNDPKVWGGWDKAFYDNEGKYVLSTQSYIKSPWYNKALLPEAKVRSMGLQVLLDPSLKGKIIWHDPLIRGSGRTAALLLRKSLGDAAFKKLITEQDVQFVANQNDMVDKMARGLGTIAIGPNMVNQTERHRKAGVKIEFEMIGNTADRGELSTGGGSIAVFNKRPHPNAARVFVNWVLSKRIAAGIAKATGNDTRRHDVEPVSPTRQARVIGEPYIEPAREDATEDLNAALKVVRQLRGK